MIILIVSILFFIIGVQIGILIRFKMIKNQKDLITRQDGLIQQLKEFNKKLIINKNDIENQFHRLYNQFLTSMTYVKPLEEEQYEILGNKKEIKNPTIDEILDKINREGIDSLTEEEKEKLKKS